MDDPMKTSYFQSGLYFHAPSLKTAKAKPFIQGLRFPFVALKRGTRVYVWARTPYARRGQVAIQQTVRGRWKKVASIRTDRYGIAEAVLKSRPAGSFRAVFGRAREKSLPFSMHVPPDQFFNPFGQPTLLEPNGKSCSR
jgi:hypothetical protein